MTARICGSCGEPLSAFARFCTTCGTEQPEPDPAAMALAIATPVPGTRRKTAGLAVAALVLGIAAYPLWFAGFVAAPLAVVFAIVARREIAARPAELGGQGLALGGMIAGLVWMSIASMIVLTLLAAG